MDMELIDRMAEALLQSRCYVVSTSADEEGELTADIDAILAEYEAQKAAAQGHGVTVPCIASSSATPASAAHVTVPREPTELERDNAELRTIVKALLKHDELDHPEFVIVRRRARELVGL